MNVNTGINYLILKHENDELAATVSVYHSGRNSRVKSLNNFLPIFYFSFTCKNVLDYLAGPFTPNQMTYNI